VTRFRSAIARGPLLAAVTVLLLLSTSCAVMSFGRTQEVPVTSQPPRAQVLVDGKLEGLTPVVLELERGRDHTVVVRLGVQQRTVVLRSGMQTTAVVLDLVPVAVSGGILVSLYASDFFVYGAPSLEPFGWGLVAASFAPLLIDVNNGALNQLTPGEIIVTFDGR
jgi:hypothetical protein